MREFMIEKRGNTYVVHSKDRAGRRSNHRLTQPSFDTRQAVIMDAEKLFERCARNQMKSPDPVVCRGSDRVSAVSEQLKFTNATGEKY